MIKNEKIKASEVHVTGLQGEDLGVMSTKEALLLAKKLKVDLVCTSLMSSPPPCKLIGAGRSETRGPAGKAAGPQARASTEGQGASLNTAHRRSRSGDEASAGGAHSERR